MTPIFCYTGPIISSMFDPEQQYSNVRVCFHRTDQNIQFDERFDVISLQSP